jgi:hypothetical protein
MSVPLKAALVALAAFPLVSATQSGIVAIAHPEIVRVDCETTRGTAFRIGPNLLVTAAHVSSGESCKINGEPIHIIRQGEGDFALLASARRGPWLKVDCGGYIKGRQYVALGYARGLNTQTSIDLEATGEQVFGMARLWAVFNAIPGQSGGPIEDADTGRPVGIVNTYNAARGDTGSVELRDTAVCRNA